MTTLRDEWKACANLENAPDIATLRAALAAAKAAHEVTAEQLHGYIHALAEAERERDKLQEERKILDKRIHHQRMSNRANWEIVESRRKWLGSDVARRGYCRLFGWFREQRDRAERAEADLAAAREVIKPFADQAGYFDTIAYDNISIWPPVGIPPDHMTNIPKCVLTTSSLRKARAFLERTAQRGET